MKKLVSLLVVIVCIVGCNNTDENKDWITKEMEGGIYNAARLVGDGGAIGNFHIYEFTQDTSAYIIVQSTSNGSIAIIKKK